RQRRRARRVPGYPAPGRQQGFRSPDGGERLMAAELRAERPPAGTNGPDDVGFKRELVQLIPHLRAFARTLCGDPAAADDLAQDAMMKAWDARASFQMGTNMKAWTFMILRN